jgi:cytochrome P450
MALASQNAPLAPGLPILGNALKMRLDPLRYLLSLYQQYGPVFRINAAVQGYTVMAGIEANRFLAHEAGEYLHSRDVFEDFAQEFGSTAFLTAIDGEAHRHQRKVQRRGYSREAMLTRLSDVVRVTRDTSTAWQAGDTLTVLPTFQRMVTDQLSTLLTGQPSGAYFDDLRTFLSMNMNVNVMKTYPKIMLRLPHYRKAKQRVI